MSSENLPILSFILDNYKSYNARALRDAFVSYWRHIEEGGHMFWAIAGAMSTAQLGITLAPAIREGLIHGISCTGANIEESIFRLVAHHHYKDFSDYRYFRKEDDSAIRDANLRRVTDTSIPEDEAFRAVEKLMVPMWKKAHDNGERHFWHEYLCELVKSIDPAIYQGRREDCWLLAAAEKKIPIVVPGHEDSTFGNIFTSYVKHGTLNASIVKSGIEYMADFYDRYKELSAPKAGCGFFQIGGGIAGDFPICVVPSIKYDLEEPVKPWAYFCQISDSTCSYGSYSGATPNEKITWDKLTEDTPMYVIESDATIVAPLIIRALLEAKHHPAEANAMIEKVVGKKANTNLTVDKILGKKA